ncbi:MAG: LacI family DNA-binding transcriptional regulator [Lachnospiraceae bacterium]
MITIKEVAELVGVSTATVSRVINNSGYVNVETRKKVEEVVKRYNYVPSANAVNLSRQETNMIGVVVPEIDNMFYGEIVHGITEVADENGLSLIFFDTQNNEKKEIQALWALSQQRVKGLLLAPAVDYTKRGAGNTIRKQLEALNIPVVILDRDSENVDWDGIFYQNYESSYQVAKTFYEAGHYRVGIITGDLNLKIGRDRFAGFVDGARDFGLQLDERDILKGDFHMDKAFQLAKKMFLSGDFPDAVYTCNNRTSTGFMKAAFECGIKIGKDIGFMGNDKIGILDSIGMGFSCVYRDTFEMGRSGLRLLLDRLEHPDHPPKVSRIPYQVLLVGTEKKQ